MTYIAALRLALERRDIANVEWLRSGHKVSNTFAKPCPCSTPGTHIRIGLLKKKVTHPVKRSSQTPFQGVTSPQVNLKGTTFLPALFSAPPDRRISAGYARRWQRPYNQCRGPILSHLHRDTVALMDALRDYSKMWSLATTSRSNTIYLNLRSMVGNGWMLFMTRQRILRNQGRFFFHVVFFTPPLDTALQLHAYSRGFTKYL